MRRKIMCNIYEEEQELKAIEEKCGVKDDPQDSDSENEEDSE
jgi:hypothetical protein